MGSIQDMPPADPEDHTPDQGPTPLWFPTRTDSLRYEKLSDKPMIHLIN